MDAQSNQKQPGVFRIIGDMSPGERTPVLLLLLNLTIILVAYSILKVVREPLILNTRGGALWKSYSAAAQAVVLMGFVPLYGWFSSKVSRTRLILGVNFFFLLNIEIFSLAVKASVPNIGVFFYVWLGIFSLSVIAQFWSLANDLYSQEEGKRLFPVIAIGATLGSPIGSKIAALLFDSDVPTYNIMHYSTALLGVSILLYGLAQRQRVRRDRDDRPLQEEKLSRTGGFTLLFKSRYLLLMAVLLLLLNIVNTTGGNIIFDTKVVDAANAAVAADPTVDKDAFVGSFYGRYLFMVNMVALLLQTFAASRIVKYFGISGAVLLLPLVALGAYSTIAAGAGFAMIRWMKTAENATDYSIMNTARAMLWLPTSRDEKYKAKQAIDTFVVRIGDLLSAAFIYVGINYLRLGTQEFAVSNVGFTLLWILVAFLLLREHKRLKPAHRPDGCPS